MLATVTGTVLPSRHEFLIAASTRCLYLVREISCGDHGYSIPRCHRLRESPCEDSISLPEDRPLRLSGADRLRRDHAPPDAAPVERVDLQRAGQ